MNQPAASFRDLTITRVPVIYAATPAAVFVFSRRADYAEVILRIALWEVFVRHMEHAQSFPAKGRRQATGMIRMDG